MTNVHMRHLHCVTHFFQRQASESFNVGKFMDLLISNLNTLYIGHNKQVRQVACDSTYS